MNSNRQLAAGRPGSVEAREAGLRATHVIKTLAPTSAGARRLARRFGADLICVRHRLDASGQRRITTVELVVDICEIRPRGRPDAELPLRLAMGERALRASLQQAGGRWDAETRLWWLPKRQVMAMGLEGRVVRDPAEKHG